MELIADFQIKTVLHLFNNVANNVMKINMQRPQINKQSVFVTTMRDVGTYMFTRTQYPCVG